jgi:hypothetical protein
MEYYSPEYFLEPVAARTLHKPLLPSITNFSTHEVSIVPMQEARNPSQGQTSTRVHCSTSSSAACANQASVVDVTPSLINFSEQIPTSVQKRTDTNTPLSTAKSQSILPAQQAPSAVTNASLSSHQYKT